MILSNFLSRKIHRGNQDTFSTTIHSIAIGSVAIGIMIMVLAFFILGGFKEKIYEKNFSFSGHINVNNFSRNPENSNQSISKKSDFYLSRDSIKSIKTIQNVAYKFGLMKTTEGVAGILLKGMDQSWDSLIFKSNLIAGNLPNIRRDKIDNSIVVSKFNADLLNLKVGDKVVVTFIQNPPRYRKLKIVGIYETGMEEFDKAIGICDLRLIRKLNGWEEDQVGAFEVFVKDFQKLDEAEEEIISFMDYDLNTIKITDKFRDTFDWLLLIDQQVLLFIGLILFVACFNMASVLLILIMEKTQMIGILKSLGASNKLIRSVFFKGGMQIVGKGLLIGNALTLVLAYLQDRFKIIPLDYENYFMHSVPISWDWGMFLMMNLLVIVVVGLTLFIPTAIINRVNPVNAIKFS